MARADVVCANCGGITRNPAPRADCPVCGRSCFWLRPLTARALAVYPPRLVTRPDAPQGRETVREG